MKFLFLSIVVLATVAVVTSTRKIRSVNGGSSETSGTEAAQPSDIVPPGHIINWNHQCRSQGFKSACNTPEPKTCNKLRCLDYFGPRAKDQCTDADVAALDGTPCSPNAECSNGECRTRDGILVKETPL